MDIVLVPFLKLINTILSLYFYILVASVVMSWLLAFGAVNTNNQMVSTLTDFLFRVTEPTLRPIRRILPNFGGLDISPVIMILFLYFIQDVLSRFTFSIAGAS